MKDDGAGGRYALRSVGRALDVLQALGKGPAADMGVGEIAEAIGVSRSTAFTLLQTLVEHGFVSDIRIGGARRYRLGLALVGLGDRAAAGMNITELANPILQQLTEATGLTSRLAIPDDGFAVAIARVDAQGPFRFSASLGRRELPHCSSVGKSLLSRRSDEEVAALCGRIGMPRRTDRTLTTPEALIEDLKTVRARGYALDDEEDNAGVLCIGSPVFDHTANVVAAISVTTMKLDFGEDRVDALGRTVASHAAQITRLLGGRVS
jgi:IclR family transcriptional regulator, acetate operon repressor